MNFFDAFKDKTNKKAETAELHHGEIFELWAHLVSRYDVLKKTQLFATYAHDPELKIMLNKGNEILNSQIKQLEDIFEEYGIVLPDRPPKASTSGVKDPSITDQFIYREVLNGMGQFLDTHIRTLRFMWNDNIRAIIQNFLIKELDLYDKWIKYGKFKGWINIPPRPE